MLKPLIQRTIVAVNGSEQSLHAAMYAILMAKQFKCQLKAVYVVDTAALKQLTLAKFLFSEESKKYEDNLIKDGTKYLNQVVELAKSKGIKIETELRNGSPWSEILSAADSFKSDLIILGGKEHDSSSINSVMTRDHASAMNVDVVGSARCNVLVVRQKDIEKLFRIG